MSTSDDTQAPAARLSPGQNSLSRNEVGDIQRARILSAMVEVASEVGYLGAAVAPVVARAGVSRRTFYELFEGREECFLAAFEWGVTQAQQIVLEAYASPRSWRDRVRHALAALLTLLDAEPELTRVCVMEALGAGRLVLERRAQVLDGLVAALDAEAPRARGTGEAPLLTAEGIVGGAFSVIHGRLLASPSPATGGQRHADRTQSSEGEAPTPMGAANSTGPRANASASAPLGMIELHGQLMALIALPYLGPRSAGEELTRQAPAVQIPETAHLNYWTLTRHGEQMLSAVQGR